MAGGARHLHWGCRKSGSPYLCQIERRRSQRALKNVNFKYKRVSKIKLKPWRAGQLSFELSLKNGTADTTRIKSGTKLADVERESENEKLCLGFLFAPGEKSSESVIFLDHTKSSLNLY